MAYVNSEKTKEVRTKLNLAFPKSIGWEISVSMEHHSTINVAIMRAPVDFMIDARNEEDKNKGYINFNVYHLGDYQTAEVLKRIKEIANEGNFDKSDLMTDYHHVGFYLNISTRFIPLLIFALIAKRFIMNFKNFIKRIFSGKQLKTL